MTPEEMINRAELGLRWRKAMKEAIAQARAEALQEAADAILRYPFAWPRHMPEELAACIKALPGAQA